MVFIDKHVSSHLQAPALLSEGWAPQRRLYEWRTWKWKTSGRMKTSPGEILFLLTGHHLLNCPIDVKYRRLVDWTMRQRSKTAVFAASLRAVCVLVALQHILVFMCVDEYVAHFSLWMNSSLFKIDSAVNYQLIAKQGFFMGQLHHITSSTV